MASNSCEIQETLSNDLRDHEARPEEANPEASGGDECPEQCITTSQPPKLPLPMASNSCEIQVTPPNECLKGMDLAVYNAAKQGYIDALSKHMGLDQIKTPTENTILHIYIACATSTNRKKVSNSANVVKQILEMCPNLLLQSNKIGDTALHIAARYGRTVIVAVIVDMIMQVGGESSGPIIISTINDEGDTALHEAVRFNHFDVVKMLTTQRTSYSANVAGETPLYMAAERGYRDVFFQILDSCTDPAYHGPNGRTALHAAVIRNDKEMAEELLKHISGRAVDEQGCTPLHLAVSLGRTSIVELLLNHDKSAAYVKEKDENKTPLHFAASKGHLDVMKQLISQCPDCCELVDKKSCNFLHYSILADEEIGVVDFVLKDPWLSNILLDTPLHYLADTSNTRLYWDALATDARVQLKDKLKRNGVIPGCRNVRDKEEVQVENKEKGKSSEDEYSKMKDTHLVVATLIATVSFAAGFTMPGGYQSDKGSGHGFAILARSAAFQAFVITNTIAMTLSSCSVILHLYSIRFIKRRVFSEAYYFLYAFTMLAVIAMVIAFITGTYAVLGHSSWLGTTYSSFGWG
ncbi:hypothetical protein ACLB2K_048553 [Fragaria x ananassa]